MPHYQIFLATQYAVNLEHGGFANKHDKWLKQTIDQSHGVVLTDNLSKLELLQMRKSEYYRRMIIDSIGSNHFIR